MFETIVKLKPRESWRPGMTFEKLVAELEHRVSLPGIQGAWTMPIKARIDMLSTGIRTPIGIKVFGPDLKGIVEVNDQIERAVRQVPGTRSVYAEREMGGFFLDVKPDREAIARYGLSVRDVLDVVESSIGGMDVSTTFEGRERYKINVRYPRELRDDMEALRGVLVPVPRLVPRDVRAGAPGPAPMNAGSSGMGTSASMPGSAAGMGAPGGMGAGGPASVVAAFPQGNPSGGTAMGTSGMGMAAAAGPGSGDQRAFVPLGQLAAIETVMDAPMIKS